MVRTQLNCAPVMVMRRSSGSFGRIEIRSSSEESQLMAFSARSRLPLKRMKVLAAHNELPTTTKRPCEFFLPVFRVPATASVSGPFLFWRSLGFIAGGSNFEVARLDSEELNSLVTVVLSVFLISKERASGNP